MLKKLIFLSVAATGLLGCTPPNLQESMFGLKQKPYLEPTAGDVATLVVEAPLLKRKMGIEDKITVSFYNTCTESTAFRNEGYIGGFELSSNDSIGKRKQVNVATDLPVFIEVGYAYSSVQCTNKFRLLPEAGETYLIQWKYEWGKCSAAALKKEGEAYVESSDLSHQNNKGGFFAGGSGRTTSEWRKCNKDA